MCLEAVLIVGNSLGVDSLGKIGKSRVIDPLLLLLLLVAVAQTFFFKVATSCQTLDKLVSRKACSMWITYFRF